jgi:hypothetical protein
MSSPSDESWSASRISASAEISMPVVMEEEEDVNVESPMELALDWRQQQEKIWPYVTIKGKTTIFFFTFRVLYGWDKYRASIQFVNNFLALASTITALAIPENDANRIIGALSLLLAQIILHSWYGFSLYPPLDCTQLLNPESSNGELETVRDQMSLILHGKEVHNDQKWQTLVTLPFTLPNVLALVVAEKVLWAVGNWCCGDRIDQHALRRYVVYLAMFVAALFWPLVFFITDESVWKVLASFAILANEELYNSYLFRKDHKKFLLSFLVDFIGDFLPLDDMDIPIPGVKVASLSDALALLPDEPTNLADDSHDGGIEVHESDQVEEEHLSEKVSVGDIEEALEFKAAVEEELDDFKEKQVDDDSKGEESKEKTATAVKPAARAVLDLNDSSSESESDSSGESD